MCEIDLAAGALLRKERILRGCTQQQLGDAVDVTFQQIQKYENGINHISVPKLIGICNFLKIKPEKFISNLSTNVVEEVPDLVCVRELLRIPPKTRRKMLSFYKRICADLEPSEI